jgi:hypothetical protein
MTVIGLPFEIGRRIEEDGKAVAVEGELIQQTPDRTEGASRQWHALLGRFAGGAGSRLKIQVMQHPLEPLLQ